MLAQSNKVTISKQALQKSLEDLLLSKPSLLAGIVEDICLAEAIRESKKHGLADKKSVESFFNENRV